MNQDKLITIIYVKFKGKSGRERLYKNQLVKVAELDGHVKLTDEQKKEYSSKAWDAIESQAFKLEPFKTVSINVNHGKDDGEMRFMSLYPVQNFLIKAV